MSKEILLHCKRDFTLLAKGGNLIISRFSETETIPISSVQSFVLKEPGAFSAGVITIRTAQTPSAGVCIGAVFLSGGAERVLNFKESELEAALEIQAYVAEQKEVPAPAVPAGKVVSVAEEIRALKSLVDDGILTPDEFTAKKAQLLGI